jgi:hypothetical protein
MPVYRFHSVEEMNQPRWREPGDPELYRAIAALWSFGQRTGFRRFPPGVYRHRSIEDLDAQTEQWAAENFESFVHARQGPDGRRV